MARWKLKHVNNETYINEDLKPEEYKKFKELRTCAKSCGITKVWTFSGEVFVKVKNKKFKVKASQDLKCLINRSQ